MYVRFNSTHGLAFSNINLSVGTGIEVLGNDVMCPN
ncbi:MAG: hypothetical protein ACJAWO_000288 [Halieaceae bacterium]|jgi:hypothetical protein